MPYVKLCPVGLKELATGAEIGRRLGVMREAVRQWRSRPGFSEPLGRIARAVVWDWPTVEAWVGTKAHQNRPGRG